MQNYNIFVTSKAQMDLATYVGFVLQVSKDAALSLANDFEQLMNSLRTYPERNPSFQTPRSFPFDVRKQIVNGRYIILYSIEKTNVVVYRILDSRRKFDQLLN